MRWIQHWIIGEDCLRSRRSLPYQLGCLLPDWFHRRPIHRWDESADNFLRRAEKVRTMPRGAARDWNIGLLAHFLCDYCTEAHNEEYYRFYRHRVYEVMAQKRIQRLRAEDGEALRRIEPLEIPPELTDPAAGEKAFSLALRAFLTEKIGELRGGIRALGSAEWVRDERVADLDIRWAHRLLYALLCIFGEEGREEREDGQGHGYEQTV